MWIGRLVLVLLGWLHDVVPSIFIVRLLPTCKLVSFQSVPRRFSLHHFLCSLLFKLLFEPGKLGEENGGANVVRGVLERLLGMVVLAMLGRQVLLQLRWRVQDRLVLRVLLSDLVEALRVQAVVLVQRVVQLGDCLRLDGRYLEAV